MHAHDPQPSPPLTQDLNATAIAQGSAWYQANICERYGTTSGTRRPEWRDGRDGSRAATLCGRGSTAVRSIADIIATTFGDTSSGTAIVCRCINTPFCPFGNQPVAGDVRERRRIRHSRRKKLILPLPAPLSLRAITYRLRHLSSLGNRPDRPYADAEENRLCARLGTLQHWHSVWRLCRR